MTSPRQSRPPAPAAFLKATLALAADFGWQTRTFERETETVCVAAIPDDPSFSRFVWVYDTERVLARCMLVGKQAVPPKRKSAMLELCARVNEGLPFGCLEYSFGEHILVFRDSADLDWGPTDKIVGELTSRVLNLGKRYVGAARLTLDGKDPEMAMDSGVE